MNATTGVEPSHRWIAFVCSGMQQSSMPVFSFGSIRRHQTGCVCSGIPTRQQNRWGTDNTCSA